jgi:hypothetical protein
MPITIRPATRRMVRLKMALTGPPGSGKTFTSLKLAHELATPVVVLDTEYRSAELYLGLNGWQFDVINLPDFSPERYIEAIDAAEARKYGTLIIDTLSHSWMGPGGTLDTVERVSGTSGNNFAGWRKASPMHTRLLDRIVAARVHIIFTLRVKMDYAVERDLGSGRMAPRRVGLAPVHRDGIEYVPDIIGDLDLDHVMTISKSRCPELSGRSFERPGTDFIEILRNWLETGVPEPEPIHDILQGLIALYGPEAILKANGGAVPGTSEEIERVKQLLETPAGAPPESEPVAVAAAGETGEGAGAT